MTRNRVCSFLLVSLLALGCGKKNESTGSGPVASPPQAATPSAGTPTATTNSSLPEFMESSSPGTPVSTIQDLDKIIAVAVPNITGFASFTTTSEIIYDYSVTNSFKTNVSFSHLSATTVTGVYSQPTLLAQGIYHPAQDDLAIVIAPSRLDRQRIYILRDKINILGKILYTTDSVLLMQEEGGSASEFIRLIGFNTKNPSIQRFRIQLLAETANNKRLSIIKQTFQTVFSGTVSR